MDTKLKQIDVMPADNLMKQSNAKNYEIKTYRLLGFPYQHIVYGTS
jgi:hypothetical protein